MKVDIVADMSWGDTGKGKVTSYLAKNKAPYNFVCRWAGGSNAGHTIYFDGNVYKTHIIPSGIFHGITSVIGPACVLHVPSFMSELEKLKQVGFDTSLVKVSPRTHIVTDAHINYDKQFLRKKV